MSHHFKNVLTLPDSPSLTPKSLSWAGAGWCLFQPKSKNNIKILFGRKKAEDINPKSSFSKDVRAILQLMQAYSVRAFLCSSHSFDISKAWLVKSVEQTVL